MSFWMATLILNLIIPMFMSVIGLRYIKNPPPNINWMYGYRTQRSMKNQETWEFAQRHFGNICFRLGTGFVLLVLIAMFAIGGETEKVMSIVGTVLGTAEGIILIYLLIPTERALEKKFHMTDSYEKEL